MEDKPNANGTLGIILGLAVIAFFCSDGFFGLLLSAAALVFSLLLCRNGSPRDKKLALVLLAVACAVLALSAVMSVRLALRTGDWTAFFYQNERVYNRKFGLDAIT